MSGHPAERGLAGRAHALRVHDERSRVRVPLAHAISWLVHASVLATLPCVAVSVATEDAAPPQRHVQLIAPPPDEAPSRSAVPPEAAERPLPEAAVTAAVLAPPDRPARPEPRDAPEPPLERPPPVERPPPRPETLPRPDPTEVDAPAPPQPEEPERWVQYVHAPAAAPPTVPADADAISAHDAVAEQLHRKLVVDPDEGPTRRQLDPTRSVARTDGVEQMTAVPTSMRGDDPDRPASATTVEAAGGRAARVGTLAPERDAPSPEPSPVAAPATEARSAAPSRAAPEVVAVTGVAEGAPEALDGTERAGAAHAIPTVVARLGAPDRPGDAADAAPHDAPPATEGAAARSGRDGATADGAVDVQPSEARAGDADGPSEGDARTAVDLVAETRASLGWGRHDDDHVVTPVYTPGELGGERRDAGSDQTVLPQDWDTSGLVAVDAVGTPLGAYLALVERLIGARWHQGDLPLADRILGAAGDATVRFRVTASGEVHDVRLVQRSGHPVLDALALAAVPSHLPRFPADVTQPWLVQRVTLHYRNAVRGDAAR
ncbi:MAG: energy transducer TonB [Alphaproteobacteria bacterium]|nr:energy transducer TonB [Alphaproteobacteria bacterium]